MNEFTKDELEDLLMFVEAHRNSSTIASMNYGELSEKIQFMIDNCCDHQSDGLIYTSNPPQNKCKKCGEFYR